MDHFSSLIKSKNEKNYLKNTLMNYKDQYQEIDYLNHQNNSNTGYNVDLLANELYLAQKDKEYSLESDDDDYEVDQEELNESEKYAVD